ncbi:uracil-DNA glycosylase [Paenibacillus xylaniclasticus]|uniref:uracil-DNA glycosylase n=1 Tax=Paenibacillus xylaniclasticus TaxID=588083 RepID=UPI000FDCA870|nr:MULTISPECIES: uracil-DNA glycosylase [Paenibacillus]GFN34128.1 uracil-DNA glycosylase [Paenibacillus curdlanolyticus]
MREIKQQDWMNKLLGEMSKPYYEQLIRTLEEEYAVGKVYPAKEDIFKALELTSYEATRVVILGQDPYHGEGQAHGLSFSVKRGVGIPPSLRNIYKELESDIGCKAPAHGSLESWARQGVLLLNSVLTVREALPNSHKGIGWEKLTDAVIAALNERDKPVVFILWGNHAQAKASYINQERHSIIASPHPSPLSASRGFFGSRPFSKANEQLKQWGCEPIDWSIPE